MPTLWKYVLRRFVSILALCVCAFVMLMLVLRLNDIARFASKCNEWETIGLFMLYQIPHILPIALPVSCLVAAFITMRGFCERSELTSWRAASLSISKVCAPLFVASLFLVVANFYFASELNPLCRMKTRQLVYDTSANNPLFLLQKSKYVRLRDTHVDLNMDNSSKRASDLNFVTYADDRLSVVIAKKLKKDKDTLKAKQLSIIGSKPQMRFDDLIIENVASSELPARDVALFLRKPSMRIASDSLPWRFMRLKSHDTEFEMIRRISYAISPLTFTLIGLSFGIHIGRQKRKRALFLATLFAALCLTSILIGKSFEKTPVLAALCYFLPHPLAIICALGYGRKKERGVE